MSCPVGRTDADTPTGIRVLATWTNLVDEVEDLGQDADAFPVVDNVVVEVACLLQHSALVQVGEGVHCGREQNGRQ